MTLHTDLPIPRLTAIVDRALDCRASAVRLHDDATTRQIDRLIDHLPNARMSWQLGTLHIVSPSGGRYQVSRAGCSCPNGQAGKRQCWHITLHELLLEMFETDCETADMRAESYASIGSDSYAPLGQRLAAARRAYL